MTNLTIRSFSTEHCHWWPTAFPMDHGKRYTSDLDMILGSTKKQRCKLCVNLCIDIYRNGRKVCQGEGVWQIRQIMNVELGDIEIVNCDY